MKLIKIQQQFFRLKNREGVFFCVEAETDSCLNVRVVRYIKADSRMRLPEDWQNATTQTLRGDQLSNIQPVGGLGMAYQPASRIHKLDTQTPDSMGNDIHNALAKLTKAVGGDVTDFVCERLQWSREEIEERLFAEQVDAVALILYNFEARNQAMIIGDQTGIGKGRVASSIIRYAKVHGLIPVYCTENAGLFSDNYRDLCDIGCGNLKPFIVNSSTTAPTDARITTLDENDETVVVYRPITDKKVKAKIYASGRMPDGYDYILTTYSQLQNAFKKLKGGESVEGADIDKYYWLLDIAPNAVFIFDESHNISGSKATQEEWWNPDAPMALSGSNQFFCFNELAKKAKNAVFLSATFAKRPENLVVYANRTCISEAGLKDVELIQAISDGGEALQEIISSDIVGEGQMIRRESIYKGIKVNYIYLDKQGAAEFGTPDLEKQHRAICDYITEIINAINRFEQDYVMPIMNDKNGKGAQWGDSYKKTSEKGGANHAPLFSKLFRTIDQLLFAIKAEAVADHAIRRLNEGKKVVIGLSSTMEAFVKRLLDEDDPDETLQGLFGDIAEGDEISCDFSLVLDKMLEGTLRYTVDGEGGFHEKATISLDELPADGEAVYHELKQQIAAASSGISLSPIDMIVQKIEAAVNPETGEHWKVTEVTGRAHQIRFTNKQGTRGVIERRKKVTRNIAFSQFQNNQSDVLIINASGATGASAHATTKNTNLRPEQVKPRVMIIAQPELDVNKEVQKRGRINRTGQIKSLPPSYDYLISAIPAEKRLMMMLQKKLKSLDANSTSNQKQSTNIIDTPDFFNKYGNEIANDYLLENPLIDLKLNNQAKSNPDDDEGKKKKTSGLADDFLKKVSGYVPLLTCEEQEDFYNTILDNYLKHIENLKKKGEYDLEVEAMDLKAELIGDLKPLVGASAGESKFADAVYQGTYWCNVLSKPFAQSEVQAMIRNFCGDYDGKQIAKTLAEEYRKHYDADIEAEEQRLNSRCEAEIEEMKTKDNLTADDQRQREAEIRADFEERRQKIVGRLTRVKSKARFIENFYCGRACIVDGDTNAKAICLGAEIGTKTNNKFAPSNITITFAVANSTKSLDYNIADNDTKALDAILGLSNFSYGYYGNSTDTDAKYLENWNTYCKEATADREQRVIIVGNILRGYKSAPERSKLISFTTADDDVLKGLLVPKQVFGNGESGTPKLIMSKYPLAKFKPVIMKVWDTPDDNRTINLTRGMLLMIGTDYYRNRTLELRCTDPATMKRIEKMQDWLDVSPYGRGFEKYSDHGKAYWEMSFESREALNTICDLLEKYQFQVELLPTEAEQYFGKPKANTLKQGNWKPLKTDVSRIPTSKSPSPDTDRPARLRRAKAKAKELLAYAKRQR